MPIFFFKFRTGNRIEEVLAAWTCRTLTLRWKRLSNRREIVGDAVRFGRDDAPEDIIITDDRRLSAVTLADVLPITMRK
jgi:hypothetical protein